MGCSVIRLVCSESQMAQCAAAAHSCSQPPPAPSSWLCCTSERLHSLEYSLIVLAEPQDRSLCCKCKLGSCLCLCTCAQTLTQSKVLDASRPGMLKALQSSRTKERGSRRCTRRGTGCKQPSDAQYHATCCISAAAGPRHRRRPLCFADHTSTRNMITIHSGSTSQSCRAVEAERTGTRSGLGRVRWSGACL